LRLVLIFLDTTISRILDDVLSLQKIEDGAFELHFGRFPMQAIVEDVARSFKHAASAKGVHLQVLCDTLDPSFVATRMMQGRLDQAGEGTARPLAAPIHGAQSHFSPQEQFWLEGDLYRLHQVVANFISNGMRFTSSDMICCMRIDALVTDDLMACVLNDSAIKFTSNGHVRIEARLTYPPQVQAHSPVADVAHSGLNSSLSYALEPNDALITIASGAQQDIEARPLHAASMTSVAVKDAAKLLGRQVFVRVTVKDSGIGLSRDDAASLFEAYRQVSVGKLQKGE